MLKKYLFTNNFNFSKGNLQTYKKNPAEMYKSHSDKLIDVTDNPMGDLGITLAKY